MITILDLPVEIHEHILRNDCLSDKDLLHFSETCTRLREMCKNIGNHVWRKKFYASWPEMREVYILFDHEHTANFMDDTILSAKCRKQLHEYLEMLVKISYTEDIQNNYPKNIERFIFNYSDEFLNSAIDLPPPITRKFIKATFSIPISPSKGAHPMTYFFIMDSIRYYPFMEEYDLKDPRNILRYQVSALSVQCITEMYLESESRYIKDRIMATILTLVEGILSCYWSSLNICRDRLPISVYYECCNLCRWFNHYKSRVSSDLYRLYTSKRSDLKTLTLKELRFYKC